MAKLNIKISDIETGETKEFNTDGHLLLYTEGDKIKMSGKMDMSALAPVLTKIVLERLNK